MPRSEKPRLSPTERGRFEKQEIQDVKEEGGKEGGGGRGQICAPSSGL